LSEKEINLSGLGVLSEAGGLKKKGFKGLNNHKPVSVIFTP